jgi:hypothetical protein
MALHYFSPECAQHRSPSRLFDFSSRSSSILVFHNLPFGDRRRLIFPEINLVLETIGRVEDCFDNGVYDFAAVHADADVVADFELVVWLLLWHLRPILNIVPLGRDGGYIS